MQAAHTYTSRLSLSLEHRNTRIGKAAKNEIETSAPHLTPPNLPISKLSAAQHTHTPTRPRKTPQQPTQPSPPRKQAEQASKQAEQASKQATRHDTNAQQLPFAASPPLRLSASPPPASRKQARPGSRNHPESPATHGSSHHCFWGHYATLFSCHLFLSHLGVSRPWLCVRPRGKAGVICAMHAMQWAGGRSNGAGGLCYAVVGIAGEGEGGAYRAGPFVGCVLWVVGRRGEGRGGRTGLDWDVELDWIRDVELDWIRDVELDWIRDVELDWIRDVELELAVPGEKNEDAVLAFNTHSLFLEMQEPSSEPHRRHRLRMPLSSDSNKRAVTRTRMRCPLIQVVRGPWKAGTQRSVQGAIRILRQTDRLPRLRSSRVDAVIQMLQLSEQDECEEPEGSESVVAHMYGVLKGVIALPEERALQGRLRRQGRDPAADREGHGASRGWEMGSAVVRKAWVRFCPCWLSGPSSCVIATSMS
ncbi:hypothetical protein IQ07DRAFT_599269 [Pyrenochaeta sp. DS3sAY3a]|nr:hypothetical protein IQ07DRAFT_599269 [Pyrenochaeta sp. DS3sAY3a]